MSNIPRYCSQESEAPFTDKILVGMTVFPGKPSQHCGKVRTGNSEVRGYPGLHRILSQTNKDLKWNGKEQAGSAHLLWSLEAYPSHPGGYLWRTRNPGPDMKEADT